MKRFGSDPTNEAAARSAGRGRRQREPGPPAGEHCGRSGNSFDQSRALYTVPRLERTGYRAHVDAGLGSPHLVLREGPHASRSRSARGSGGGEEPRTRGDGAAAVRPPLSRRSRAIRAATRAGVRPDPSAVEQILGPAPPLPPAVAPPAPAVRPPGEPQTAPRKLRVSSRSSVASQVRRSRTPPRTRRGPRNLRSARPKPGRRDVPGCPSRDRARSRARTPRR